jgi:hypothetical protein
MGLAPAGSIGMQRLVDVEQREEVARKDLVGGGQREMRSHSDRLTDGARNGEVWLRPIAPSSKGNSKSFPANSSRRLSQRPRNQRPQTYRVSRPKCSIFSGERNYLKQFHVLQRVKTMNHPLPFRNRKCLMENERYSILDRKNTVKICRLGTDD